MLTAVIAALAWLGGHSNTVVKTHHVVAGWTVAVRSDRFTGAVSCSARRPDVVLNGGVAVFSLGPAIDTSDAVYRINLGPAASARDVALRVRALGAPITLEPIDNPSRGLVVLPSADLKNADDVWIRAEPKLSPHRFPVSGIAQVLAYEASVGCG